MLFVFRSNTAIVKVIGPLINEIELMSLFLYVDIFIEKMSVLVEICPQKLNLILK